MPKGIIFDMDGLLVDSEIISFKMYRALLAHHGILDFTTNDYATNYSGHNELDNMNNLIQTFNLPITTATGLHYVQQIETELLEKGVALKPGAQQLLAFLADHQYLIGLATSSTADRAHLILKQNNIQHYFDTLTFNAEINHGKPAPDIFNKARTKMALAPNDALIFEDSEAGIQAANAANIPVICIPDMHQPAPAILAKAVAVYPNLTAAIAYFEQ